MLELMQAGGWLMFPILACSVVALAIIAERFWTLRPERIAPDDLVVDVWRLAQAGELTAKRVTRIREGSALGRILASGLSARHLHRTRVIACLAGIWCSSVYGWRPAAGSDPPECHLPDQVGRRASDRA